MLKNIMMKNENKSFTKISNFPEIMVADHCISNHYLWKRIKILVKLLFFFSVLILNMMKLLAEAGKNIITKSLMLSAV